MKTSVMKSRVLKMIAEGHGDIRVLTEKVKQFERKAPPILRQVRVNQHNTAFVGTPLKQILVELSHGRKIRYDYALRKYVIHERKTYQPPVSMDKVLDRYAHTIPKKVSKDILLL